MKVIFVSRHNGAKEWATQRGLEIDQMVDHFDTSMVQSGDTVVGTLPINIVAELCEMGVNYLHLNMTLPAELRGKELTVQDMENCGASLNQYVVKLI